MTHTRCPKRKRPRGIRACDGHPSEWDYTDELDDPDAVEVFPPPVAK